MATDRSFMLLIEPFEARLLLESLMLMRKESEDESWTFESSWSEHEIDKLMYDVATHAGIPFVRDLVPEAYKICFPEGPPRVVGAYGTPGL